MRLGLGLSLLTNSSSGIIGSYVQDYIERVGLDSGVSEANSCLSSNLGSLIPYNPTFLNIPSSYKSGKMYSILPSDGSADITFTRASLAYRTNSNFDLEEMASGVPRLDYKLVQDGVNGCPMWIYEPQRTNLLTYSQDFSNASWIKVSVAITPSSIISPDGSLNGSKLETTSTGARHTRQDIPLVSGNTYTQYAFFKKGTTNFSYIGAVNTTTSQFAAYTFDLENGVIGLPILATITTTASIVEYPNDWYLCSITFIADASNDFQIRFYPATSTSSISTTVGDSVYIWNAQLEQGSYATSPIKTEGSKVTRVADGSSLTGLNAKGLIGASEGSIGGEFYSEELVRDSGGRQISLGSSSDDIFYTDRASGVSIRPRFRLFSPSINTTVFQTTQDYNKWLFSWDASGWFLSVNGLVVGSGADVFTFPTDNLTLNGAGGAFQQGTLFMSQTKYTETEANNYTTL